MMALMVHTILLRINRIYSKNNIGLCNSFEMSKFINNKYVVYSHDDMFCKNWDLYAEEAIKMKIIIFLSGTNVSYKDGIINYDCGSSPII